MKNNSLRSFVRRFACPLLIFSAAITSHAACTTPPSGLISWWPGEGNGTDISGGNHALQPAGGITFSNAEVGTGFTFSGSTNQLLVPDAANLNFGSNQNFSIEAWIQPQFAPSNSPVDEMTIVYKRYAPDAYNYVGYALYLANNGQLFFLMGDAPIKLGGLIVNAGPDLRDGNFHHVAVTLQRNATNGGHLYVDGTNVLTFDPTSKIGALTNSEPLLIGSQSTPGYTTPFKGRIDELSLYSRGLDASEISAIFAAGTAGKCNPNATNTNSGAVVWWPAESNAVDAVSGNIGTPIGAVGYAAGVNGQAFTFDHSTSYITVPASASLNLGTSTNGLTIHAWVKPDAFDVSGAGGPVIEWDSANTDGLQLWTGVDLFANVMDTSGNPHTFNYPVVFNTNRFQHIALTYDKTSGLAKLYLNGTNVASSNIGSITPQTTYPVNIGRRTGQPIGLNSTYGGSIDDLTLYKRPLSAAEIQAVYLANAGAFTNSPAVTNPVPVIAIISPTTATNGAVVTILGTNFSSATASNVVYFGAVRANVLAASANSLSVVVPTGATFAPVTVTVNGLTAWSKTPFVPTFAAGTNGFALATRLDLPAGDGCGQATIADVDGDGKPDLLVNSGTPHFISIYRNVSTNGALISAASLAPRVDVTIAGNLQNAVIADFDGDGKLDLAVLDRDAGQAHILKNNSSVGNVTTNAFTLALNLTTGNDPRGLAAGDWDGDGLTDLAVANWADSTVSVYRHSNVTGLSSNAFTLTATLPVGAQPQDLKAADLDGDGRPDFITANNNSGSTNSVSLLRNVSTNSTIAFATQVGLAGMPTSYALAIGDVDGDGKLDIAASSFDQGQSVSIYRNVSTNGSWSTNSFAPRVDFNVGGWGNGVALGDLTGDGKLDLAVVTQLPDHLSVFKNVSSAGNFTTNSLAARVDFSTGWNPNGVTIGDVDGDGRPDLAFAVSYGATLSLYQNQTLFAAPATCTTAPAGIVGWWPGENTAVDISGTNNGTVLGGASYVIGEVGQGFQFNGTSSYLKIPQSPSLNLSNQITIEFWMKPASSNAMNSYQGLVTSDFYFIEIANGFALGPLGVSFGISTDSGASVSASSYPDTATVNGGGAVVSPGQWHHVAGTYDGTKLQLYIDGQPWGSPNYHTGAISPMLANSFVSIGSENGRTVCSDCVGNRYFNGLIDEPTIYNRALSTNEILAIYQAGSAGKCAPVTPPPTSIVVNGSFENPSGIYPYQVFSAGTSLPGWTIESGTVEITAGTYWQSAEGAQSLDLNGIFEDIGTIYQDVPTVPGQNYKVRFAFAGNPECGLPTLKSANAYWNGTLLTNLSFDITGHAKTNMGWVYYEQVVTATSTSSRLRFQATSPTFCGMTLDDVSVVPTNAPAVVVLADSNSPAQYNDALGTILDGTSAQFPVSYFSGGGDPTFYPAPEPNLTPAAGILGNWLSQPSALNTNWRAVTTVPATWALETETAIVYRLNGGSNGIAQLRGDFDADNGIYVWVNGVFKFGACAPGLPSPTGQFEYTNVALGSLSPGVNYVQVLREDNGISTGSQIRLWTAPFDTNATTAPCAAIPPGLVGWWSGESTPMDYTGTNTGVLVGGVGYTAGEVGQGFNFTQTNQGVRIPANPSLDVGAGNGFTLEAWIKVPDINVGPSIFEWNTSTYWGVHFAIGVNQPFNANPGPGELYANVVDSSGFWHQFNSAGYVVTTNEFQHVALTYDRTSGVGTLYRNGIIVAQQNLGSFTPLTGPGYDLNLGRRASPPEEVSSFAGVLDEPAIYNRALGTNEIMAIYQAGSAGKCNSSPTPYSSSLVLDLPLDGSAVDVGPNHFTVTTNGGGLFVTNRFLQQGSAIALDGAGQNLSIPFDARLNPTEFTFSAWAKFQNLQGTILRSGNASTDAWRGFGLTLDGGILTYQDFTGGAYNAVVYASSNLVVGNWYHIVATRTTNACVVYVNGIPTGSQTGLTPYAKAQVTPLSFGSNLGDPTGFAQFCPVTLDTVHLYSRALSSNEVAQLYQFEAPVGPTLIAITQQPTNISVAVNNTAVFTVVATGTPPLSYQWSFNGSNIIGATNTTLTLNNVQLSQAGNYSVIVANQSGSVTSSNATLNVQSPPIILSQTPSQVVLLSNAVMFAVNAGGTTPLRYAWFRNNSPIANATNFAYTLPNAQLADSGSTFYCVVTNAYSSVTSTNVSLKVIDTIANDLCSGAILITNTSYTNAQSTVRASSFGDPTPGCTPGFGNGVWYQFTAPANGLVQVDTFGSDFDTGLVGYAGDCGNLTEIACNDDSNGPTSQLSWPTVGGTTYYILAGGYGAHVGNLVLHLNHFAAPAFDLQPTNVTVVVSSNAAFNALVSGTQPITYQWYLNQTALTNDARISGATNLLLSIANLSTNDGGNYVLVASNWVSVTTSSVAVLTPVILPPSITQQPADVAVFAGTNVSFNAAITGTPPFDYQWWHAGAPVVDDGRITGATTLSLNISNVTSADGGTYALVVTNLSGSDTSIAATLTVLVAPSFITQPIGRSVPPGLPTTFNASASASPAPTYQWLLNGTNLPGATNVSLVVNPVGTNQLGSYQLVASNLVGVSTSSVAQLTFGPVAAWGRNFNNESLPPPGLDNVFALSGVMGASFAVRTNGNIVSWGVGAVTNVPASATNVVAISSFGTAGAVALRSDGTVVGWNGATVPAFSNLTAVALGNLFGMGLRTEGTLVSWGATPYSIIPAGLNQIKAVACGNNHTLVLRNDGSVFSWGAGAVTNVPVGMTNIAAIAAGYSHSLVLRSNGTVAAWGTGNFAVPAGLTNVAFISANGGSPGQSLNLAVRSNNTVVAWGDNVYGETAPPAALTNLVTVSAVAAPFHGLALVNDGSPQIIRPPVGLTTYAGRNLSGVLRGEAVGLAPLSYQWLLNGTNLPGATNASLTFANLQSSDAGVYQLLVTNALGAVISLPAPLKVISTGPLTFLSQTTNSITNYQGSRIVAGSFTVQGPGPLRYQWFFSSTNRNYAPLAGATNESLVLEPALAVQSGFYYIAISNLTTGITSSPANIKVQFARAWGYGAVSNPPINVTNAIAIATGGASGNINSHYLALGADGRVTTWGNYFFSLGETNIATQSNTVFTAIAASYQHSLGLKSDGTVYASGGSYGQSNAPTSLNGVVAIACGDYHDLALKSDGTVVGWGAGGVIGQINFGQTTNNPAATNVVAIAAGQKHSLALRADGSIVGWGYNVDGATAIPLTATNVVAIAAGSGFSVALKTNGTVVQWGSGITSYPVPANLSNVVAISASSQHVTALKNDGSAVTWGYGYTGLASNSLPADLANVASITSSGEHDFALFGTRAPSFTVQPWNRVAALSTGTSTTIFLAGKCVGTQPVSYQWRRNGTNIVGATNDVFAMVYNGQANTQVIPGNYQLVASNAYGITISKAAKVTVVIPLSVALDTPNDVRGSPIYPWTTSGGALWFGQTNITHDGVDAARSGAIGSSQETILQTTVSTNIAGYYSFWWKVSSEDFFDVLEFRLNGIVQASISGEQNWQLVNVPAPIGTNTLQWRYAKDGTYDVGFDAAWVDQFTFLPNPPVIVTQPQPAIQTVNAGTNITLSVSATGAGPLRYLWTQNGVLVGGNSPSLVLNSVARAQAGTYSVTVTNLGGATVSSNATLVVRVPQQLGTPTLMPDGSLKLTSGDAGGGLLTPADLANFEAQGSTNLVDWTTLPDALSLTNGLLQLQDAARTNFTTRYYRIVEH